MIPIAATQDVAVAYKKPGGKVGVNVWHSGDVKPLEPDVWGAMLASPSVKRYVDSGVLINLKASDGNAVVDDEKEIVPAAPEPLQAFAETYGETNDKAKAEEALEAAKGADPGERGTLRKKRR